MLFRSGAASLSGSLSSLRASDESPQLFNATVDQIKEDHIKAARGVVRDEDILRELEDDLDYDCERLRSFLLAAQVRRRRPHPAVVWKLTRPAADYRRDLYAVEGYHRGSWGASLLSDCDSCLARSGTLPVFTSEEARC